MLVRRIADGDRAAFRVLVNEHQRALLAYTTRMLGDRIQAEDVVQETFLRLWTRAASFRSERAGLTTWLHNIAHNLCIDSFRRAARRTRMEAAQVCEDECGDERGDPEAEWLRDRRQADVRRAVSELPERQRSALLMCHYQGLSNRDAAAILGVSVEALESLLARARRQLKKTLGVPGAV